jgi:hypothetical protein
MTVPTQSDRAEYLGNGFNKVFAVPFPFIRSTELRVSQIVAGVETVLTSGYAVSGGYPLPYGTVTLDTAPPSGSTLRIRRVKTYTQLVDLRGQGPMYPEAIEQGLDDLEMQIQQLHGELAAALSTIQYPPDFSGFAGCAYAGVDGTLTFDEGNPIAFGTKVFDDGDTFTGDTFTAPHAGRFRFTARLAFAGLQANDTLQIRIVKNGSTVLAIGPTAQSTAGAGDSGFAACAEVTATVPLSGGDTVSVFAVLRASTTTPTVVGAQSRLEAEWAA